MVVAHARFGDTGDSPFADAALALLGSATSDLLAPCQPSELFDLIVEQVGALAATPHAYLCLMEPDGRFMLRAGTGIFENLVGQTGLDYPPIALSTRRRLLRPLP